MRAITTREQRLLDAGCSRHIRVLICVEWGDDPEDDVWRDLTDIRGTNWLVGARWGHTVDEPISQAEIQIAREHGQMSTAPLMEGSPLNQLESYAPLLQLGAHLVIDCAVAHAGEPPASEDWVRYWHGVIQEVDWSGSVVRVIAHDMLATYRDSIIEHDLIVGDTLDGAVWQWQPSVDIEALFGGASVVVRPPDPLATHSYLSSGAANLGTTGATEPTWPSTNEHSATISDGTVTWQGYIDSETHTDGVPLEGIIKALTYNALALHPYWSPSGGRREDWPVVVGDPDWSVRPYIQAKTSVLEAIQTLVAQRGWSVHHKYVPSEGGLAVAIYEVDRDKSTVDYTFGASDILSYEECSIALADIRTAVQVVYSDITTWEADGVNHPRRTAVATDEVAQEKYGRRWSEIALDSSSEIDTAAEAQDLADAVCSDLSEPLMSVAASVPFFPWAELGDRYTLSADGIHFDVDQTLAVTSIQHEYTGDVCRTILGMRGKPAGQYRYWLRVLACARKAALNSPPPKPSSLIIDGYLLASWSEPSAGSYYEAEVYVRWSDVTYEWPTIDSTYLRASGRLLTCDVSPLGAASLYCCVLVRLRDRNGLWGEPAGATWVYIG
jgi:hypothetical protein